MKFESAIPQKVCLLLHLLGFEKLHTTTVTQLHSVIAGVFIKKKSTDS